MVSQRNGCWQTEDMIATRSLTRLYHKTRRPLFHQGKIGRYNANTTKTSINFATWSKTPFCFSNDGEVSLPVMRKTQLLSLPLFKFGAFSSGRPFSLDYCRHSLITEFFYENHLLYMNTVQPRITLFNTMRRHSRLHKAPGDSIAGRFLVLETGSKIYSVPVNALLHSDTPQPIILH